MTESVGLIENTERKIQSLESVKTFLICCLILTVPDFFDSLKRPRGSDESRGRCCLCGKLCAADFILESVKKLEELFIAPTARQILHETVQRAFARCECA